MPQADLDRWYHESVDVLFNLERMGDGTQTAWYGGNCNGWPLGVEAMMQGVVLFTTDVSSLNQGNGFLYGEHVNIVELDARREHLADIAAVLARLHMYAIDSVMLREHSARTQVDICLLYTSPSPRDGLLSRMPSSA